MELSKEDGYELWLRYRRVENAERLAQFRAAIERSVVPVDGATVEIIRNELTRALPALLDRPTPIVDVPAGNCLLVGTCDEMTRAGVSVSESDRTQIGAQGFLIRTQSHGDAHWTVITANSATAVLTGVFHFLRLLQTQQDISTLEVLNRPAIGLRIHAHWDRIDGSVERGYAGRSLWQWDELPGTLDPRYHDYARACASLGLNGVVLNNVNASPKSMTAEYLEKTAALADLFRPYGIRVYQSPNFSSPLLLGELPTADPRDPAVAAWWKAKVDEIYRWIPDFGGFQVKANSEGQPGPQDDGANHDDGANMLADALAPHGGLVLWRAFVYDVTVDADRHKCAFKEFVPLDAKFRPNVIVQVKNGAIDYMPREPFHPLFGSMPKTPLALELQVTQEYLGQSRHLVYLGGMWQEVFDSDTCAYGPGSTVAKVVDGTLDGHALSCVVGVANTGSDRNWCGHHFSQANWYAYGRQAWDHRLRADDIADEWIRMTWGSDIRVRETLGAMLRDSWPACINYMTPLGLHHLMVEGHHYGPDPKFSNAPRPDWANTYFHRADSVGLGFERSSKGSNATSQYHSPLREQFDDLATCPEMYLLWFHHVSWSYRLASGRTLWEELQYRYASGAAAVEMLCDQWRTMQPYVDAERFAHVTERLDEQLRSAREWRDVCLDYFGGFAKASTSA